MTLQGAIKQLHELRCNEDMPVFFKPVIAEVINVLLMDAEEVRHGRWIIYPVSTWDGEDVKCSVCGEKGCAPYWDYCPHCGSQMVEVVSENEL